MKPNERIQSILFDFGRNTLLVNGHRVEQPVLVEWPFSFEESDLTRRMLLNAEKVDNDDGYHRIQSGEKLPVMKIEFIDGTGSLAISNKL